uniref:Uncharacterized protein n=1 Tax=Timema cristinae TaxID=61476 RepID=A0A7R9CZD0_TIMCR|nr:unnamed protein product [Timema cristinae]
MLANMLVLGELVRANKLCWVVLGHLLEIINDQPKMLAESGGSPRLDPNNHTNENKSITKEYLIKTTSSFEETGLVEDPASHHYPDTLGNDDNDLNRCTTSNEYGSHVYSSSDEENLDESYEESQRVGRCVGSRGLDCFPVRRIQCVRETVHCFNNSMITILCGFQQTPRAEGNMLRTPMFQLVYPPELTMIIPFTPFQFLSEFNFHGTLYRYDQQLLQLNNIVALQWVESSEIQGTLLVQDRIDDKESTTISSAASQEKALNDLQDVITAHGERRSSYSSRRRLTTLLSEDIQPVVVERLIGDARRSMFYFQGPNPVTTPLGPWHNPQNGSLNLTANQIGLQDTSNVTFRDHMMASQRRQRQSRAERDTTMDDDWYRRRRERRRAGPYTGSGLYNFDQEETSLRRLGVTTYRQALENYRNQTRIGRSFQNTSQPARRETPSEHDEAREFPYNSNSILNTIDVTASREVVEPEETISDSLSSNPPIINLGKRKRNIFPLGTPRDSTEKNRIAKLVPRFTVPRRDIVDELHSDNSTENPTLVVNQTNHSQATRFSRSNNFLNNPSSEDNYNDSLTSDSDLFETDQLSVSP